MAGEPFYVDWRKWPDAPHWHYRMYELGEDAHGRWFCLPRGSVTQRRPESPRTHRGTTAKLFPRAGGWVASFNTREHGVEVYVDVVSEAVSFRERSVTLVDLDLDVVRDWAGETRIIDVDEFHEHRVSLRYPDELVAYAERTAEALRAAVAARSEPFDRHGAEWLERALAQSWPLDPHWLGD